jgi:hypothetical protein
MFIVTRLLGLLLVILHLKYKILQILCVGMFVSLLNTVNGAVNWHFIHSTAIFCNLETGKWKTIFKLLIFWYLMLCHWTGRSLYFEGVKCHLQGKPDIMLELLVPEPQALIPPNIRNCLSSDTTLHPR